MNSTKFTTITMASLFFASVSFMACNDTKKNTDASSMKDEIMTESITNNTDDSYGWTGSYEGTLPCADCEGIETIIVLNEDNTYHKSQVYLTGDNPDEFDENGTIEWNKDNFTITLYPDDNSDESSLYKVEEDRIIALSKDGSQVTGAMAKFYILEKQ